MHAFHKDSHFAQIRLFMHLVLPCRAADPFRVALRGWEACELIRETWGEQRFAEIWHGSSEGGPVNSFKLLLSRGWREIPGRCIGLEEQVAGFCSA
jgi:hypothetical protein